MHFGAINPKYQTVLMGCFCFLLKRFRVFENRNVLFPLVEDWPADDKLEIFDFSYNAALRFNRAQFYANLLSIVGVNF